MAIASSSEPRACSGPLGSGAPARSASSTADRYGVCALDSGVERVVGHGLQRSAPDRSAAVPVEALERPGRMRGARAAEDVESGARAVRRHRRVAAADRAAFEVHDGCAGVLGLDLLFERLDRPGDLQRQAEQEAHQVELMDQLRHHGASSRHIPPAPPAGALSLAGPVKASKPMEAPGQQPAERAAVAQPQRPAHLRAVAKLVDDRQPARPRCSRLEDPVCACERVRQRLLADRVLARGQRVDDDLGVGARRGANDHEVDIGAAHEPDEARTARQTP